MLTLLLIGLLTVAVTVVLHAGGTAWWLQRLRRRPRDPASPAKQSRMLWVLIQTAVFLIVLHVVEVFLWALTFYFLPRGGLASLEEAMYFSFSTYTTLGYGDVTIAERGRLLTGIESLNGMLLVGWSTAVSFAVIQRVWERAD